MFYYIMPRYLGIFATGNSRSTCKDVASDLLEEPEIRFQILARRIGLVTSELIGHFVALYATTSW